MLLDSDTNYRLNFRLSLKYHNILISTNLKATKKLIYKKLYMIVCQLLSFDNVTEVSTHQMCH